MSMIGFLIIFMLRTIMLFFRFVIYLFKIGFGWFVVALLVCLMDRTFDVQQFWMIGIIGTGVHFSLRALGKHAREKKQQEKERKDKELALYEQYLNQTQNTNKF